MSTLNFRAFRESKLFLETFTFNKHIIFGQSSEYKSTHHSPSFVADKGQIAMSEKIFTTPILFV